MAFQLENLKTSPGFDLSLKLKPQELNIIREEIFNQWFRRLQDFCEISPEVANGVGIQDYHLIANENDLPHSQMWPKLERILPLASLNKVRALPFMTHIKNLFGDFTISDEEDVGREEMYWRIVRPNCAEDVGPIHADKWFWELGHGHMPLEKKRVKVWIPIFSEPNKNGLIVIPDSHISDWKYHGERRHGLLKPVCDEPIEKFNKQLLPLSPGEVVIFNDGLLHGGAINKGSATRVSLEFTIFVDEKKS